MVMTDNFQHHLSTIRSFIYDGFEAAKHCHTLLFSNEKEENINLALTYLNQANTFITSAKTIYRFISLDGENAELEDFFHQFSVFNNEVLTNVRTDHSHQWSDIEFNRLKEIYSNLAETMGLPQK